jgi:macrodomain Ter protein organizer (MatP/YcbG family)
VDIDIEPQVKIELEAIAREKGITLNDLIVQALTEAVEQGEEIIALNSFHNVEEEPVKSTPTKKQPVKKSPSKKQTRKAK